MTLAGQILGGRDPCSVDAYGELASRYCEVDSRRCRRRRSWTTHRAPAGAPVLATSIYTSASFCTPPVTPSPHAELTNKQRTFTPTTRVARSCAVHVKHQLGSFSPFHRTPTCDRQTDRQTDRHGEIASTQASMASRG